MTLQKLTKDWYMSYDVYSDLLQIYDDKVFTFDDKDLIKKSNDLNTRVIFNKKNNNPLLLEVKNVYSVLGKNIDSLAKKDIINLLEPYFFKYVQYTK